MIKPPYLPLFLTQMKPRKGLESLNYQHSVLPWSMLLRYWFLLKENRPSRDYLLPLSSEQLFLNTSAQLSQFIFYLFCYSCVFSRILHWFSLSFPFTAYTISLSHLFHWVLPFLSNFISESYHSYLTFSLSSTILFQLLFWFLPLLGLIFIPYLVHFFWLYNSSYSLSCSLCHLLHYSLFYFTSISFSFLFLFFFFFFFFSLSLSLSFLFLFFFFSLSFLFLFFFLFLF